MAIKYLTIKNPKEFKISPNNCFKSHTSSLTIIVGNTPQKYYHDQNFGLNLANFCRIGITVSKQVSKKSTIRNLAKRRIKNALKTIITKYGKNHCDYIIIAKKNIVEVSFKNIYNELESSFKKLSKF
jgi:ribonuclease P protein component